MKLKVSQAIAVVFALACIIASLHLILALLRTARSTLCRLPVVSFVCDSYADDAYSAEIEKWRSGATLLFSKQRLDEIAKQMELKQEMSASHSLHGMLRIQANLVNDNAIDLLKGDADLSDRCAVWSHSLHTAARDVHRSDLELQLFAQKVVSHLPDVLESWKNGNGDLVLHAMSSIRQATRRLRSHLNQTDQSICSARNVASALILSITRNQQLTETELVERAQTWSWPKSIAMYSIAAGAAVVAGPEAGAAAAIAAAVWHGGSRLTDIAKAKILTSQKLKYETAALYVSNARGILINIESGLQELDHILEGGQDAVHATLLRMGVDSHAHDVDTHEHTDDDADQMALAPIPRTSSVNGSNRLAHVETALTDTISAFHRILTAIEEMHERRE